MCAPATRGTVPPPTWRRQLASPALPRDTLGAVPGTPVMRSDDLELSDLIVDYDPDTLQRRPVRWQAVLEYFEARAYWIVGGALWALAGVERPLAALIAFVAALQLGLGPLLNVWQSRGQRRRMRELLSDA